MSDQPFFVTPVPKPADRSANKPIYIVVAEDCTVAGGIQYYKADSIVRAPHHVTVRGSVLTKAQVERLGNDKSTKQVKVDQSTKTDQVDVDIPWQKIVRIENVSYKQVKAQGVKNE